MHQKLILGMLVLVSSSTFAAALINPGEAYFNPPGRNREQNMSPGANWFEGKSADLCARFGAEIVPKEFLPNSTSLRR